MAKVNRDKDAERKHEWEITLKSGGLKARFVND